MTLKTAKHHSIYVFLLEGHDFPQVSFTVLDFDYIDFFILPIKV